MFTRDDGGKLTGLDIVNIALVAALVITILVGDFGEPTTSGDGGLSTFQYVLIAALIALAIFRVIRRLFAKNAE